MAARRGMPLLAAGPEDYQTINGALGGILDRLAEV